MRISSAKEGRARWIRMRRRVVALGIVAIVLLNVPIAVEGVVFSTNVRVNDVTTGDQVNSSVAVSPEGIIHVAWEDYRQGDHDPDIYYAKSTNGGKNFSSGLKVNSATFLKEKHPSIAVSNNGYVHIVWSVEVNILSDDRIYYARSTDNGSSFTVTGPINNGTGDWDDFVGTIKPKMVYHEGLSGCELHVVWSSSDVAQVWRDYGVWYDHSADCGGNFTTDTRIASLAVDASIAVALDGAVGVAYAGLNATPQKLNISFIMNTGSGWTDPRRVSDAVGFAGHKQPTVAMRSIGSPGLYEVHVAWTDSRNMDPDDEATWHDWDIYYCNANRFPSYAFGTSIRVNDDPQMSYPRTEQSEPWIVLWSSGIPKIVWTDWRHDAQGYRGTRPNNADVYYAESLNDTSFSPNKRVIDLSLYDPFEQSHPAMFELAEYPAEFRTTYIVWQDERDSVWPSYDFNIYITGYGDPFLEWCGPPDFTFSGVNPQEGNRYDTFTYCVRYRSPIGDEPLAGYPKVEVFKGFKSYMGPVNMTPGSWVGSSGDYLAGRKYTFSTNLSDGIDYSYTFSAFDVKNRMAVNLSSTGPIVMFRFKSVDISGHDTTGDQVIAVGWEKNVSLFTRSGGASGPNRTEGMGFDVNYVALSENGSFLAVAGNEKPYTNTSRGYLRLYGPITNITDAWPLKYHAELNHSILGGDKPLDITRDGSLVVVGSGIVNWPTGYDVGMVRLFQTPAAPGTPINSSYYWNRWVLSVAFSPDSGGTSGSYGGRVAVGAQDGYPPLKYTSGVLSINSSGTLSLLWRNMTDDCIYAVSLNSGGTRLGYGIGWNHNAYFWNVSGGTLIWNASIMGSTTSAHVTSNAAYFAISTMRDPEHGNASFVLWDTTNSSSYWTYVPTYTVLTTRLDMAVETGAQFIIGGGADHVYFWGASTGPAPGPTPRTSFNLSGGAGVASLAMTFHGTYSAVIDDSGRLSLYSSNDTTDWLLWDCSVS